MSHKSTEKFTKTRGTACDPNPMLRPNLNSIEALGNSDRVVAPVQVGRFTVIDHLDVLFKMIGRQVDVMLFRCLNPIPNGERITTVVAKLNKNTN